MGHPWTTTAGSIKTVGHASIAISHNENQKDFATALPKRENANELDDEMSEIELLMAGELIEPIVFEPKRKIRLSRSTYKVNSYIDLDHIKILLRSLRCTYIDFLETCKIQIMLEH